jgi:hypothetical protein
MEAYSRNVLNRREDQAERRGCEVRVGGAFSTAIGWHVETGLLQ